MISNFIHDDWMQNSTSAYDHLVGFGDEAIVALNAGIKVGLEEDDWQVVDKCVSLLSWIDPEFDPGQRPELIPFMIRQLSDDDVEGNAAAGRRYLAMCGEFARPALEEVTRTGDEQAKGYAQRLLGVLEDVESWEEHHEEEAPVHSQLPLCNEAQSSETFALDR